MRWTLTFVLLGVIGLAQLDMPDTATIGSSTALERQEHFSLSKYPVRSRTLLRAQAEMRRRKLTDSANLWRFGITRWRIENLDRHRNKLAIYISSRIPRLVRSSQDLRFRKIFAAIAKHELRHVAITRKVFLNFHGLSKFDLAEKIFRANQIYDLKSHNGRLETFPSSHRRQRQRY